MMQLSAYDKAQILKECKFETSRSSGKGGQHVNKTESRVTIVFNLDESSVFEAAIKERIKLRIQSHINQGEIRMSSESSRSQFRNKEDVIQRLFALLDFGLKREKKRVKTHVPKGVKESRLKAKKLNKEKKELRKKPNKNNF